MSFVVRPAKQDDIPWLLEQLGEFNKMWGTELSLFSADDGYKKALLKKIIDEHVLIVAEKIGEAGNLAVGLICAMFYNHPFNPAIKILSEQFWWVDEAHRESRAGALLLRELESIASLECDWLFMSLLTNSPVKPEALTKRGYVHRESSFVKEFISQPIAADGVA